MRSIFTKYIPPSNTKGSRYKAWDSDKHFKLTLSADSALSNSENHVRAAQALKEKAGWKGKMICGDTNEGIVCVFADHGYKLNPISEKTAHKIRKAAPGTFAKLTDEEIKKAVKLPKKKRNVTVKRAKKERVIYTFVNGTKFWLTDKNTLSDDVKRASVFSSQNEVARIGRLLKSVDPSRRYFEGLK